MAHMRPAADSDSGLCFVVMGFGKKTDYETGRTLDLNATYREIIKPAAVAAGLRCVRADEVSHSGHIDLPMYEMLLRADLVVADISTGNANALYELGVRHALRPYSTIIMKESRGKLYFDLNHINTFSYDHLGEDIGASEARRAIEDLKSLIEEVLSKSTPDSPVYTFIPRLVQPKLSEDQFEELIQQTEESEERFSDAVIAGETALREDRFLDAVRSFSSAVEMKPGDAYLAQQLALATYKSKEPSEIASLVSALKIVSDLEPDGSNDPETLGITGAIHKRLWKITQDEKELALATKYYGRGFEIRKDYYNGENYALCLNYRQNLETDPSERSYYSIAARKAREDISGILLEIVQSPQFDERSDQKWVIASLANTLFGLGRKKEAIHYEKQFYALEGKNGLAKWEIETYKSGKQEVLSLTSGAKGQPRARKGK